MDAKPIETEADYETALDEIDRLFDAAPGTAAGVRLEALLALIAAYEHRHWPVDR